MAKLRTMSDNEFASLPYGSEGLWRKFMHACRSQATLEEIITATKSKRYTRTRIDRMILCAYLGISEQLMAQDAPYVRVLGFRENGTRILKKARQHGLFPHIGEKIDHPYFLLEQLWDDLYGLFREDTPSPAGTNEKRRVFITK